MRDGETDRQTDTEREGGGRRGDTKKDDGAIPSVICNISLLMGICTVHSGLSDNASVFSISTLT